MNEDVFPINNGDFPFLLVVGNFTLKTISEGGSLSFQFDFLFREMIKQRPQSWRGFQCFLMF